MVFNCVKFPSLVPTQDGFKLHHQLPLAKICSGLLQESRRVDKLLGKKVYEFKKLIVGSLVIQMSPDTFKKVVLVVGNFGRAHSGIFTFASVPLREIQVSSIVLKNWNEPCWS